MADTGLPAANALATVLGLTMVAAAGVQTHGPALFAAGLAVAAVIVGVVFRPAATAAAVIVVCLLAWDDPAAVFALLSGLSATGYLMLRYAAGSTAVTVTAQSIIGALGFSVLGLAATSIFLQQRWVALLAPTAIVALFVVVVAGLAVDGGD